MLLNVLEIQKKATECNMFLSTGPETIFSSLKCVYSKPAEFRLIWDYE
jgi:hypothetical protein